MSAYKAIRHLLASNSTVVGLVAARIYPVTVPQNSDYPCLVVSLVSEQSQTLVSLNSPFSMTTARVQVTVMAADYISKEVLMNAVISACKSGAAIIDSVKVSLIISDILGPDFRDDAVKLFMQSQDFKVMYNQAN